MNWIKRIGLMLSAALVACLVLLAGCGGKGSAPQGTTDRQTAGTAGQAAGARPAENRDGRLQDVAQVLGMTADEVRSQMQKGKSLVDLIKQKGLNEKEVEKKLLGLEKARLEEAVRSGRMTRQQADELLAGLEERGLNLLGWPRPGPREAGGGRQGAGPAPPAN